jgi:hypothetical protein
MTTFAIDPHKLEELLNYCVGFAKQMVEIHGAFHPFGAVIVSGGTLTAVGADVGGEHPHDADVFRFCRVPCVPSSKSERSSLLASRRT